jgi:hypothetical protein
VVPWLGEMSVMMADISSVVVGSLYLITHAARFALRLYWRAKTGCLIVF